MADIDMEVGDEEFTTMVGSLNVEQRRLFDEVTERIDQETGEQSDASGPLKLFISGAAGTGKTFVLKAIAHQIQQRYTAKADPLSNAMFVVVTALTGVEAAVAHGKTLHNVFALDIETDELPRCSQMTEKCWKDMRKFDTIRWLIIDGISMVSYRILRAVDLRLQTLKGNRHNFGGINVLVFGDIMQLGLVGGNWCFQQPNFQGEPHLWQDFVLRELMINVRQQNDIQFIDLLNKLRVGEMSMEQYELLYERSLVPLTGRFADREAIRIFPTNRLVDEYNDRMIADMPANIKVYTFMAEDIPMGPATMRQRFHRYCFPGNPRLTGGLLTSVELAVGARVMLCKNIEFREGLVSGSMGVVRGFEWGFEWGFNGYLNAIYVEFDDKSIGRSFMNENGWVAVEPQRIIYQGCGRCGNIERTMVPLILSWAVTVHKVQGTTIEKAVIYLGDQIFAYGQEYVALSRVRSLKDVAICALDTAEHLNLHNKDALAELERMRLLKRPI